MRFFILQIVVLCFSIAATGSLHAEDWQYYAEDSEGNFLYVDKDSIIHKEIITEVWQKKVYEKNSLFRIRQTLGEKYATLIEARALIEIFCPKRTFQVRAVDYYRSDGTVIEHIYYEFLRDWKKVQRKSDMERLYKICCTTEKNQ